MTLVYLDESGNTGTNLQDTQQPIFVLAALLVPETSWQGLENELSDAIQRIFPGKLPIDFEVHAADLINPKDQCFFRKFPVAKRLELYQAWMQIAAKAGLKVIYRAIAKRRFLQWLTDTFGSGVLINPHVAAFALLTQVVNDYLKAQLGNPLGILISDENKEVMKDIEKSIRLLRVNTSDLRLSQIIEKGFFIESHQSLLLQLCDLAAYTLRRKEEARIGLTVKTLNQLVIPLVEPLIHRGKEPMTDILGWLEELYKKGAARGIASGTE
jgi:hypothetical protein